MAVREQGAKARLRVGLLHFGEELFATVGAAKHGYDALNMRNECRKFPRREEEATTLTQVSGSTSSGTQANCYISSMRRRTVRDETLTVSKIERCSGQTESTTATWHSLMKSPFENGFIQRARMRETS